MRYLKIIKFRLHKSISEIWLKLAFKFFFNILNNSKIESVEICKNFAIYKLLDGRRYLYDPSELVSKLYSVPYTGDFESKETKFLKKFIQQDWNCIDVGACFGWYSVLLSMLVGIGGKVHSFEPLPRNYHFLIKNLGLNNTTNVSAYNFGLGNSNLDSKLYLPKNAVSGALKPHAAEENCNIFNVKIKKLDDIIKSDLLGFDSLDFVKVDIEGAELLFLEGAEETIKKFKPTLMVEIQYSSTKLYGYNPIDIYNRLVDLGYTSYTVNNNSELESSDQNFLNDNLNGEYNFIFKLKD